MAEFLAKVTIWETTQFPDKYLPLVLEKLESKEIKSSNDLYRVLENITKDLHIEHILGTETPVPGIEVLSNEGETMYESDSTLYIYILGWTSDLPEQIFITENWRDIVDILEREFAVYNKQNQQIVDEELRDQWNELYTEFKQSLTDYNKTRSVVDKIINHPENFIDDSQWWRIERYEVNI